MNIKILGTAGGEAPGLSLTGFKIDDTLILDAGTIGQRLTFEEQMKIKHVLITHAHLDHIHALPFFLDNLIGRVQTPVKVYSSAAIIDVIKTNIFNNKIWPDFTVLPTPEHPILEFCPIEPGEIFHIDHYQVQAIEVNHSFMALAYIIRDQSGAVVFTGDTGPVDELWQIVKSTEQLKAVFMECSFPSQMRELAGITSHLCTSDIIDELQKARVSDNVQVYLYHLKPAYTVEIMAEANELQPYAVKVAMPGNLITT